VKYIGKLTPSGIGNGARSLGIGVMLIWRTTRPSRSRTTVPGGMRISNPGIRGVEITVSCDASHLSRVFVKMTGRRPGEHRLGTGAR
jgi:hypothetical protein